MDATAKQPPETETTLTLFRFCAKHRLKLDSRERSAVGIELSRLAREQNLPMKRVREGLGSGEWSKSRLYPESFLEEWLIRYRKAQREALKGLNGAAANG